MEMKVKEIRNFDEFKRVKPMWDQMLEDSPNDMFFLKHEWLRLWWKHFGRDKELLVLTVWDSNEPIAAAPFYIADERIYGLRCRTVRIIGSDIALRSDFLLLKRPEEALRAIIKHMMKIKNEWDLIRLDDLPADSITIHPIERALRGTGTIYDIMPGALSPYLLIEGSWEEYWRARGKSLRKEIRLRLNRASKNHYLHRLHYRGGGNVEWLMGKVLEIESKSWKYKSGTSILSNPDETRFFLDLARLADRRGWLHLNMIELDGHPAAYQFNIIYKKTILGLKTSFNLNFGKLSPGKLILYDLIRFAFEEGISEVDFGGQAESYKMRWTDRVREHRNFVIFNVASPFILLYLKPLLRKIGPLRWVKGKFELMARRRKDD